MLIGYARVSTDEQDLSLQIEALKQAKCEKTFTDKLSKSRSDRPGLMDALSHSRREDTLVVWKFDRSVKGLVDLILKLEEEGVHFKSLTEGIDTSQYY
jgi:DNA invertase Pin-like site-specific DNA recombinase